MIVQCEQCSTKFRLDDAKVPEAGVKVRCAKCRHIFVVRQEPAQEEPDFDSLLQGLDRDSDVTAPEAFSPSPPGPSVEVDPDLMRTLAAAEGAEEASEEFSFDETAVPASAPADDKGAFQEFEFDIAAASSTAPSAAVSTPEPSSFQEFSFDLSGDAPGEPDVVTAPVAAPSPFEVDGAADEFTFDVPPPAMEEDERLSTGLHPDLADDETGGFSFGEQPMAGSAPESGTGFSFDISPGGGMPAAVTGESFGFGEQPGATLEAGPSAAWDDADFSSAPEVPTPGPTPFEAPPVSPADAGQFIFDASPASTVAGQRGQTDEDLRGLIPGKGGKEESTGGFAGDSFVFDTGEQSAAGDDELPPLTIASRKVGGGGTLSKVLISCLLLLLAAGGGGWWYVQQNGIAPLAGVLEAVGVDITPRFELRSITAGYLKNAAGVDLFVVRGEVRNLSRFARGEIQVRAMIYGPGGKPLARKVAFAGNPLPDNRLASMSAADIEKAMENAVGDALANMEVRQGEAVPFAVVFDSSPAEAVDYGVEVAGSVLAGKKQ